jgi:hypothetical protein
LSYAGRIDVGGGAPDLERAGYVKDGELVEKAMDKYVGGFYAAAVRKEEEADECSSIRPRKQRTPRRCPLKKNSHKKN